MNIINCPNCQYNDNKNIWCTNNNETIVDITNLNIKDNQYNVIICSKCKIYYKNMIHTHSDLTNKYKDYNSKRDIILENCLSSTKNRMQQYKINYEFINKNIELKDKKILDFGCGDGLFTVLFDNCHKYGYDIDIGVKDSLHNKNIKYVSDIDLFSNNYDIIIFRGTIQYITDLNIIKKLLKNNLNKNGYIIFLATPNINSPCAQIFKNNWIMFSHEFLHYWSRETLDDMVNECSEFHEIDIDYPYLKTPYCDEQQDLLKFLNNYKNSNQLKEKFSFWGNMINIIFQKII
jgi:2-polyprenyl-3-methyl-5-hydroxy-6-metoxy-1,4-benzoquinol methylase